MLAQQASVRGEEQDRAIERPPLALHDADDQVGVGLSGGMAEGRGGRPGDVDGALPVAAKLLATFGCPRTDAGAEVQAARVAGDERLRENDELSTETGRLGGERA